MQLYDHFDKETLDYKLWTGIIPDTVSIKDVSLVPKHSILTFQVTKRKQSEKPPSGWEGPSIIATNSKFSEVKATLGLDFEESIGIGNVYIRGTGYDDFMYLLGIDNSSTDIFFHIFNKYTEKYIQTGKISHRFPEKTPKESELIQLELIWQKGKIFYSIQEKQHEFYIHDGLGELVERLQKDSQQISKNGLKEFCIRVDLYTADEKKPSTIKALIDKVEVRPVKQ